MSSVFNSRHSGPQLIWTAVYLNPTPGFALLKNVFIYRDAAPVNLGV